MSATQLFPVSKAAARADVSTDTLRKYADSGVVSPIRDALGRRLFSETDIEQARQHRAQTAQRGRGAK
ncbi:MAG: MerR family transcriptional regulator [Acidobacteriaceae bacterium]